jgi:hypothetical protein
MIRALNSAVRQAVIGMGIDEVYRGPADRAALRDAREKTVNH